MEKDRNYHKCLLAETAMFRYKINHISTSADHAFYSNEC